MKNLEGEKGGVYCSRSRISPAQFALTLADFLALYGGLFLDQLVEIGVMLMEISLLDVDHLEDDPWTVAKSTDSITLKHEVGVR
jgi:hypothetical protein